MKTLKITLLLAIIGLSINASAQTITVSFDDNTSYSGFYEVKLYVIDTYTQDVCLVAQIKNIAEPGVPFYSNQIDLTCVNLVSDQIDRYRYIANVARQTSSGSGQNWTPLLDTGEMWGTYIIEVTIN